MNNKKVNILWNDKEKCDLEKTNYNEFIQMFPELYKFIEHFDPSEIHFNLKSGKSITVLFK